MAITNNATNEVEYEGQVLAVRGVTRMDMLWDEVEVILDDGSLTTIRLGGPSDQRFAKVDATDEWIEKHNAYLSQKRATEMENDIITINHHHFGETTVKVVRETAKAVLLAGNASEAWFPKSAINSGGDVADWFTLRLEHQFLWQAPYTEAA